MDIRTTDAGQVFVNDQLVTELRWYDWQADAYPSVVSSSLTIVETERGPMLRYQLAGVGVQYGYVSV